MNTAPDIRGVRGQTYPPGPRLLPRLLTGSAFRADPVETLIANAQQYGDLVHFRGFEGHIYQFNHPTLIQEIMVEHERQNRRAPIMQQARGLLGNGLLTSEEPFHMRQRRLAAPAFHRQRVATYGDVIGRYADEIVARWQPGSFDVHPQMLLLALLIVGKCMFNIEEESEAREIASAVSAFMITPPPAFIPSKLIAQLQKIPFGPILKVQKGISDLDAILYRIIAERRAQPGDRGDLLSMLLAAEDAEDSNAESARMTDKQVRDECITVLLAGHETTANALSFALWLLANHPEVQEQGHAEASRVLGDRQAVSTDYGDLRFVHNIFSEAMRMMPTVWVLGRSCGPEPYDFHGFTIPPGAMLLAPQIVVHRDPRFWDNPDTFDPMRFADERSKSRPKFAYFPFGGGSRQCIGEGLAWMEGVLVLTTILRRWRIRPLPGAPKVLPLTPSVNLRPKHGVPLMFEQR